jgi:lipopolysaccharide/colanic/teichoic acid biosynthesis glycosyltransferase
MDTAPIDALPAVSLGTREVASAERNCVVEPPPERLARPRTFSQVVGLLSKRLIDLLGASLGLILLSPVLLAIAWLIRLDSPGPALFRQKRLGRDGRPFWIYKFRTMRLDAEQRVVELESMNESVNGMLFKLSRDPRVTRLGRFLRHTNLDELPQLLNILKGEMSLVGPRPFQIRDCDRLRARDPLACSRRLEFPPGLTGAWQVGRKSPVDSEQLLELDVDYIENWSLGRDLDLIYRTLLIVLDSLRSTPTED